MCEHNDRERTHHLSSSSHTGQSTPSLTHPNFQTRSLGLCTCLVDIEIVDTRNGNESNVVSVGPAACSCEDPARVALQDSTALVLGGDASKKRKISEKKKMIKKSASFNSGSELFDALLMAAADDNEGGEIVSNAHDHEAPPPPSSALKQQRSERKKRGSFNNFFDSFEQDANTSGDKKAPFIRRNPVSMILNNPVLAQTGAGDRYVLERSETVVGSSASCDEGDEGDEGDEHRSLCERTSLVYRWSPGRRGGRARMAIVAQTSINSSHQCHA